MKETMIFGLTEVARSNLLDSAFHLKASLISPACSNLSQKKNYSGVHPQ